MVFETEDSRQPESSGFVEDSVPGAVPEPEAPPMPPHGITACPVCRSMVFGLIFHKSMLDNQDSAQSLVLAAWWELHCWGCARWLAYYDMGSPAWVRRPQRLWNGAVLSDW